MTGTGDDEVDGKLQEWMKIDRVRNTIQYYTPNKSLIAETRPHYYQFWILHEKQNIQSTFHS